MTTPDLSRSVDLDGERRSGDDRRTGQRRRLAVVVQKDQRGRRDRRKGERRGRKAARAWRVAPVRYRDSGLTSEPLAELRAAALRVAASWSNSHGDAVSPEEVSEHLSTLVTAIGRRGVKQSVSPQLQSVLGRRLLELLRTEVIRGWDGDEKGPTTSEILTTLRAIESVRTAIDPDWEQHFASRLSGPDGLALVVEVAHDLRSPLTSILFLAETLQREQSGEINELQRRQLGLVYSAALGLSEMASNVIELARGGHRLADDEPMPFSITDILESVHDIVRPIAEEKGLTVRLLPPASDHRVGHPEALSRVLLNLTTNALKFTEQGFVEIVARDRDTAGVEFSVRDTGPGIGARALETLYVPFRRAAGGDDGYRFSGTGLGLGLCRRLIRAMGSELQVETQAGWGTRFYFDLELDLASHL